MAYYLRKENKKKGTYLQMYESHWDKEKKQPRSKSVMAFGYVHELISDEIPDPVAYYTDFVAEKNKERAAAFTEETRPRAFVAPVEYNLGQFLLYTLLEELNVKEVIDILAAQMRFQFRIYDMIAQLIFSRIIYPCSKSKTVSSVFPHLYNSSPISEDQVYDGLSFIGGSYKKYIELFNHCYEQHYQRDFSNVFFDCTNYYFEIDLPYEDKQKGPSKENRHDPIIGQALLLDADLVPVAMQMYPGNESEKPYIRKVIEEMKSRYKVSGKTVQVADKGLNCARNIYAAVKEANDRYIFSKSIHGRNLSEKEKKWLLLENEQNIWKDYRDKDGNLLYRLKSCVDSFSYQFKEIDPETGRDVVKTFSVKERLCHNKQLINSHFYRGVSELPYKLLFAVIYTHLEFRYEMSHTITSHHVHHFHQTRIPDGTLLDYMVQYRKPLFPQFFLYPKKFLPENNPHHKEFHLRPYIQNNANQ